jgi:hypothetical protein
MNKHFKSRELYDDLLNDLEEAIFTWQKEQKQIQNDKRFNAKKYLAQALGYKDENIVHRFLDPNNSASVKLGIEDVEKILLEINDLTPLENYLTGLKGLIK